MRIPLWIGGPIIVAASAVDTALELQARTVGSLTRAMMRGMGAELPEPLSQDAVDAPR
ncbi:hypothetical protein [Rhodococcus sp. NPDC059234]|uniref:hypothetical protein n=1 Tax=Rhodococcus sp. NPDC059234 TaxID=3346781 RepID=UPI00366D569F